MAKKGIKMNDIMDSLHAAAARSSTLSRRDLNALKHDSLIEAPC